MPASNTLIVQMNKVIKSYLVVWILMTRGIGI